MIIFSLLQTLTIPQSLFGEAGSESTDVSKQKSLGSEIIDVVGSPGGPSN